MRAVVFEQFQTFPSLTEVDRPVPGPGEVLLKVAGAGACHSDVAVYREFAARRPGVDPAAVRPRPRELRLGRGSSGPGVDRLRRWATPTSSTARSAAATAGPAPAARTPTARTPRRMPYLAVGLGRDGGMAEYLTVPARNLVPLGDADPVDAAPLADAGLTPYHAIKNVTARASARRRHVSPWSSAWAVSDRSRCRS